MMSSRLITPLCVVFLLLYFRGCLASAVAASSSVALAFCKYSYKLERRLWGGGGGGSRDRQRRRVHKPAALITRGALVFCSFEKKWKKKEVEFPFFYREAATALAVTPVTTPISSRCTLFIVLIVSVSSQAMRRGCHFG